MIKLDIINEVVNKTGITDPTGAYANAASPSYDDSAWRSVDVPHDWGSWQRQLAHHLPRFC